MSVPVPVPAPALRQRAVSTTHTYAYNESSSNPMYATRRNAASGLQQNNKNEIKQSLHDRCTYCTRILARILYEGVPFNHDEMVSLVLTYYRNFWSMVMDAL